MRPLCPDVIGSVPRKTGSARGNAQGRHGMAAIAPLPPTPRHATPGATRTGQLWATAGRPPWPTGALQCPPELPAAGGLPGAPGGPCGPDGGARSLAAARGHRPATRPCPREAWVGRPQCAQGTPRRPTGRGWRGRAGAQVALVGPQVCSLELLMRTALILLAHDKLKTAKNELMGRYGNNIL